MTLVEPESQSVDQKATQQDEISAILFNCSLKRENSKSHTATLMSVVGDIMMKNGVGVEQVHLADHNVPPGVYPDMTEHGWAQDALSLCP